MTLLAESLSLALQRSSKKCFDSADWVMEKEAKSPEGSSKEPPRSPILLMEPAESLLPKLEPSPIPPRRISNLGEN